jgi:DNA uptake protein ComE-like DNA-binding protein
LDYNKVEIKIKLNDMIDVNNCSEIELTKLKGVNIAIAKRIAKKREAIKGFKTKEEFLEFINLKPHQVDLIKNYIKIRKIKIQKPMYKRFERHVDL